MTNDIALVRNSSNVDTFVFRDGDFIFADSDSQHIQDIFESEIGWWKEFPLVGVGINNYINSSGKEQEIQGNASIQLRADGYQSPQVDAAYAPDGSLNISTNAIRN